MPPDLRTPNEASRLQLVQRTPVQTLQTISPLLTPNRPNMHLKRPSFPTAGYFGIHSERNLECGLRRALTGSPLYYGVARGIFGPPLTPAKTDSLGAEDQVNVEGEDEIKGKV